MTEIVSLREAVAGLVHDGECVAMEGFTHLIPSAAGHEVIRQCRNAYVAGAANLPFSVLRGYQGSDLPRHNTNIRFIRCPFTNEELAVSPAIRPDVTIIHAQKADRRGNVLLWGILGVQKEAAMAAKRVIVTVEQIVDRLDAPPNACILPRAVVSAVCLQPGGAFPSYAHGYYARDNRFYIAWDDIARDREVFKAWMQRHVLDTADFDEFRRVLAETTGASA